MRWPRAGSRTFMASWPRGKRCGRAAAASNRRAAPPTRWPGERDFTLHRLTDIRKVAGPKIRRLPMKVVVTGGSGQLGTLVLERLLARPEVDRVVSLDVTP